MHQALEKLAKQLNAYDEDSLMMLWERYAMLAKNFEPTARWEEGILVFGMLQAVRWKNQLFNYHLGNMASPAKDGPRPVIPNSLSTVARKVKASKQPKAKATILRFPQKEQDE